MPRDTHAPQTSVSMAGTQAHWQKNNNEMHKQDTAAFCTPSHSPVLLAFGGIVNALSSSGHTSHCDFRSECP